MGVAWELERADCLLVQRKEIGEPTVEVIDSRRWEEAPASQTSLFLEKGHKERRVMQGIG